MTVAIVHDWLTGHRGGENVLEEALALLPSADLLCVTHVPGSVAESIERRVTKSTWLSSVPALRSRPDLALPLLARAVEGLDLSGYEAVLSISHCVAVGARARGAHLVYALSPMRYAWDGYEDYARAAGAFGPAAPLARFVGARLRSKLREWDRKAGERASVRAVACVSEHVRARVGEAWRRDARVVYPPVDTEAFAAAGKAVDSERRGDAPLPAAKGGGAPPPAGERFVALGAARPNKRLELVCEAFRELALPLDVIGPGSPRALERLRRIGGPTVSVHGELSREDVISRVAASRALVHAAAEDFGIAPVEALAAGRPVVAFARSGVRESVAPPGEAVAGVLFDDATPRGLADALRRFLSSKDGDLPDASALRARAERFSKARFRENFSSFLRVSGGEAFARALAPSPLAAAKTESRAC